MTALSLGEVEYSDQGLQPWSLLCLHCFGDGCEKCGGLLINHNLDGGEPLKTYIGSVSVADYVFQDVSWLIRHGVLPMAGGRYEQPAIFVDADQLIQAVKSGYDAVKRRMQHG